MADVTGDNQQPSCSTSSGSQPIPSTSTSEPMASTSAGPAPVVVDDFLNTGRTGRRNALADILDENSAFISTADLPDQLQALSFGPTVEQCGSSGAACMPSTSKVHHGPSSSSTQPTTT